MVEIGEGLTATSAVFLSTGEGLIISTRFRYFAVIVTESGVLKIRM